MKLRTLVKEDYASDMKAAKDSDIKSLQAQQDALNKQQSALKAKESELRSSSSPMSEEKFEDIPDKEGQMAKTQLYTIIHNAHGIYKQLKNEQQLPAWWQSHLAKAEDLILQMETYLSFKKRGKK